MANCYVCTTDNLNRIYYLISLLLQLLLNILRNRQHRGGTEGIAGMDSDRIDIFNEAYRYHVALCIADNLQLQLFPAQNGLFYENLSYKACLKTSRADRF